MRLSSRAMHRRCTRQESHSAQRRPAHRCGHRFSSGPQTQRWSTFFLLLDTVDLGVSSRGSDVMDHCTRLAGHAFMSETNTSFNRSITAQLPAAMTPLEHCMKACWALRGHPRGGWGCHTVCGSDMFTAPELLIDARPGQRRCCVHRRRWGHARNHGRWSCRWSAGVFIQTTPCSRRHKKWKFVSSLFSPTHHVRGDCGTQHKTESLLANIDFHVKEDA